MIYGLIKTISIKIPGSYHAYYLRHFVDNFKKMVKKIPKLNFRKSMKLLSMSCIFIQVLMRFSLHNKKHWAHVFQKIAYYDARVWKTYKGPREVNDLMTQYLMLYNSLCSWSHTSRKINYSWRFVGCDR